MQKMVFLTYNQQTIEFSDSILNISTYLDGISNDRETAEEAFPLLECNDKVFSIFKRWFEELSKQRVVKYNEIEGYSIIYGEEYFNHTDFREEFVFKVDTLIEVFNFAFANQIRLLCNTIAHIIALRNIKIYCINDVYYTNSEYIIDNNFKAIHLQYSLMLMILNHMSEDVYRLQPYDVRKLQEFKESHLIHYTPYLSEATIENIYYDDRKFTPNERKNIKLLIAEDRVYTLSKIKRKYDFENLKRIIGYNIEYDITAINFFNSNSTYLILNDILMKARNITIIPSDIKIIGERALEYAGISEIVIPEGVEEIGNSAFAHCISLKHVYTDKNNSVDSFPSSLKRISRSAFNNCKQLQQINFPNKNIEIDYNAFCKTQVKVPKEIFYCDENTETIKIADIKNFSEQLKVDPDLKIEDVKVFDDTTSLHYMDAVIFDNTLINYHTWKIKYIIPENVKSIGPQAFKDNDSIEEVIMHPNVKTIEYEAFKGCKNLKTINLKNVKVIGDGAFENCPNLKNVSLNQELASDAKRIFRTNVLIEVNN